MKSFPGYFFATGQKKQSVQWNLNEQATRAGPMYQYHYLLESVAFNATNSVGQLPG